MIQTIHVFKCELLILTLSNCNHNINNNNDMNCVIVFHASFSSHVSVKIMLKSINCYKSTLQSLSLTVTAIGHSITSGKLINHWVSEYKNTDLSFNMQ